MPDINPDHIKALLELINQAPFFIHMGMRVTELDNGHAKVEARLEKTHMNPFGGPHGGVYASLLDTAAYWSAYCDLERDQGLISIDLKVDFLAPVTDHTVFVTGRRIKSGRTLSFAEAHMVSESGKTIAHGTSKLITTSKQTISDAIDYLDSSMLPTKFMEMAHAG